ncbi:hypothetical protein HHK36_001113 [Tetracentron sinense]|uniref:Branchpoint-bridging protein n=1 Tax=Tetracentron sinense TaxID=13715 RepID=A0A835A329_TETSI|nr:hypothetical protein HHK36_001113 [Tetracentron sinense]
MTLNTNLNLFLSIEMKRRGHWIQQHVNQVHCKFVGHRKKCKQEHSLKPELDVGSAVTDLENKSGISKHESFVHDDSTSEQQERTGSSGRRRRSRWDPQPDGDGEAGEDDRTSKRRRTRWAVDESQLKMLGPIQLPDFMREFVVGSGFDPEIRALNMKLLVINRKLLGSEVNDNRTEEERSPSPQLAYNNLGIRKNSRDVRFREKLIQDRQHIISRLIQKKSTFKPPSDYKPSKLYKKIYLPLKEYPGYNFVGLIIGRRGNTKKRMEKETGARIVLKGNDQKSLDAAVGMVEKLLIPVVERMKQHKLALLKELAELKGTLRDENLCKVYGEHGNKYYLPSLKTTFIVDVVCDTCGGNSHSIANCPLTASAPGSNVDFQGHNFLADLGGGGGLTFATFPTSSSKPGGFSNSILGTSSSYASCIPGLSSTPNTQINKKVNDGNLYVGYLPQTVDDSQLRELFSPFGRVIEAKVIKDHSTGFSKGYGFVKYDDLISASTAVAHMNGHKIDGKMLAVRVAGQPPTAGNSVITLLPKYPGSAVMSQDSINQAAWSGPPGSMLPVSQASFSICSCISPVANVLPFLFILSNSVLELLLHSRDLESPSIGYAAATGQIGGYGYILRDAEGRASLAGVGCRQASSILEMELLGICRGLENAIQLTRHCESDSLWAVCYASNKNVIGLGNKPLSYLKFWVFVPTCEI